MRNNAERIIKISKEDLISRLKENLASHLKDYKAGIAAYKKEVTKQLALLQSKNAAGELRLQLELTEPVDNSETYEKVIEMFEWELATKVELTQAEFKQYVQDDNSYANAAYFANTMYLS